MSIQGEITRITNNVQDTIDVIEQTGVSIPAGANSDDLPDLAAALANEKQDKLTGQQGQVVGFNASGEAVAQAAPQAGITQSQADARYLQLSGGTMPDDSTGIKFPMNLNNPFAYSGDGENYFSGIYFTGIGDVPGIAFITRYGERPSSPGGNHILQLDDPTYGSGIMAGASYTVDKIKNPLNLATKAYVDSKRPKYASVTLTAAGWSNNQQTATVNGVSATETAQLIQPMPAVASQQAYMAAGIYCSGQAANSLTFTCTETPTENLTVYVVIQEVSA